MDFTDDPFRDYRYEDPFNITDPFDDDDEPQPMATSKSADNIDAFARFSSNAAFSSGLGGRQSVPLPNTSSSSSSTHLSIFTPNTNMNTNTDSGRASAPPITDPFAKSSLPSEDQQLAWAAAESLRLEEQRKLEQLREVAELEYVLAISKQQNK